MMTSRIKAARKDREWSQTRLIGELERVAHRRGQTLPSRETLKARVSRWENNHAAPDEFYRRLLREALGLDDRELGFVPEVIDAETPALEELRARLSTATQADAVLLDSLRNQTEAICTQDRQYGAGALLEQMRGHVNNIEQHLGHTVFDSSRRPLAVLLADAASLAGWQALDRGGVDAAWRFFETAGKAALQGGESALYAFSRVEQAHVLVDLDDPRAAAQLVNSVWAETGAAVAPGMRCWLAAAAAEMHATAGEKDKALGMLSVAESVADAFGGELPPYLVFNQTHLERWCGHTLVLLRDPAAEARVRQSIEDMDSSFTRAGAALRIDLAASLQTRGETAEAAEHLKEAELLARRVGSRRQMLRLQRLRNAS
jgi:transcriptional regulator with XRE-family HTH domain